MSEPVTHDYGPGKRGWGHDFSISRVGEGGLRLEAIGHGPRRGPMIRKGDYLLIPKGEWDTRYLVEEISYYSDPDDMWQAALTFAPRSGPMPAGGSAGLDQYTGYWAKEVPK